MSSWRRSLERRLMLWTHPLINLLLANLLLRRRMNLYPSVPKNSGGTNNGCALAKERYQPSHRREESVHHPSKAPLQTSWPTGRLTMTLNIIFGTISRMTYLGVYKTDASHAPQSLTGIGGSKGTRGIAFNVAPQNTYIGVTMVPQAAGNHVP
ncbi:hypothetical protein JCGZ_10429 [Jatropha curcas]|uniref:Uncharacterized protein n=1 Tax=Jatropha curcas TaxID=180498 RepID=A0A067KLD8_JATCU|nr:hypothetical protein JCGZ_10429 [Jatropha curcas]